jgi:hypothetical protein
VIDELKRVWKEAVVAYMKFAWRDWELRKSSFRIAGVSGEIRTEHFQNTNLERYRYTKVFCERFLRS